MSKGRRTYPPLDATTVNRVTADNLSQADRLYFEHHPEATYYTRDYVVGESPALPFTVARVQVNKLEANLRSRFYLDEDNAIRCAALDFDGHDRTEFDHYTRIYRRMLHVIGARI